MTNQYISLLDRLVAEKQTQSGLDTAKAFELLVNELVMRRYDLSVDEIEQGITDGGGDGQIDAVYVIVNGHVVTEEEIEEGGIPTKGPLEVEIVFVQSKFSAGFEENPLKSVRITIRDLLDLSKNYSSVNVKEYNSAVQSKFHIIRSTIVATSGRQAVISAKIFYASKGDHSDIHHTVLATRDTLVSELKAATTASKSEMHFLSPERLVELSRVSQANIRELNIEESLTSDGESYACLVSISALFKFLSDENGQLIRPLFDANVRDYLGNTDVNDGIHQTLQNLGQEEFWWYNNGITIITGLADQKGRRISITNPLIVNGLQTSNVIHAFMNSPDVPSSKKDHIGKKLISVRIIPTSGDAVRDAIIRATNSQTAIPKPFLRGMDNIHRNIEDYLRPHGLYYERRKNHYKNQGIPRSSIVTLPEMAQSLVATLLFRGGDARGRPTSLLRNDNDYAHLFNESYNLDTYLKVIQTKRRAMTTLISEHSNLGSASRNDVIWHILAYLSASKFYSPSQAVKEWHKISLSDQDILNAASTVISIFDVNDGDDKVAKSSAFQNLIYSKALCVLTNKPFSEGHVKTVPTI